MSSGHGVGALPDPWVVTGWTDHCVRRGRIRGSTANLGSAARTVTVCDWLSGRRRAHEDRGWPDRVNQPGNFGDP